jgi:hypothetical protein
VRAERLGTQITGLLKGFFLRIIWVVLGKAIINSSSIFWGVFFGANFWDGFTITVELGEKELFGHPKIVP